MTSMGVSPAMAMVIPIVGAVVAVVLSCIVGRIVSAFY